MEKPAMAFFRILYLYNISTITLQVPETLELDPRDTARFLAAKLYESGKLSLGQAAALCGMSKTVFAEILGDYNVSLINYPVSEIKNDAAKI